MKKELTEVTKQKKSTQKVKKDTYGLDFVPSEETIQAMKEAKDIASGKIQVKGYSSFQEMWDDLIGD